MFDHSPLDGKEQEASCGSDDYAVVVGDDLKTLNPKP